MVEGLDFPALLALDFMKVCGTMATANFIGYQNFESIKCKLVLGILNYRCDFKVFTYV